MTEQEELHTALLEAVNTLSPKNRSTVLLFYHEQFSLQEVANRLNISVSAVKGRLHKSRHQLRKQLTLVQDQIQPNSLQEIKSMTVNTSVQTKLELRCSFCSKRNDETNTLIAGPIFGTARLYICNECVDVCNKIISGKISPLTQEEVEKLINSGKLSD